MLEITKNGNSIRVKGLNNDFYPNNGELDFPLNSIIVVVDESDMISFKSAANYDNLFSGLISDITIDGSTVTKETIIDTFSSISNSSGTGGEADLSNYYTKSQVNTLLTEVDTKVDSNTSRIEDVETAMDDKQDILVSGANIKTIMGQSILGEGNLTFDNNIFVFVDELPTEDIDPNKIYIVPSEDGKDDNLFIEYFYKDDKWEKFGEFTSDVDLSDYYNKTEIDEKLTPIIDEVNDNAADISALEADLMEKYYTKEQTNQEIDNKINDFVISNNVVYSNLPDGYTHNEFRNVKTEQDFINDFNKVVNQNDKSNYQTEFTLTQPQSAQTLLFAATTENPTIKINGEEINPVITVIDTQTGYFILHVDLGSKIVINSMQVITGVGYDYMYRGTITFPVNFIVNSELETILNDYYTKEEVDNINNEINNEINNLSTNLNNNYTTKEETKTIVNDYLTKTLCDVYTWTSGGTNNEFDDVFTVQGYIDKFQEIANGNVDKEIYNNTITFTKPIMGKYLIIGASSRTPTVSVNGEELTSSPTLLWIVNGKWYILQYLLPQTQNVNSVTVDSLNTIYYNFPFGQQIIPIAIGNDNPIVSQTTSKQISLSSNTTLRTALNKAMAATNTMEEYNSTDISIISSDINRLLKAHVGDSILLNEYLYLINFVFMNGTNNLMIYLTNYSNSIGNYVVMNINLINKTVYVYTLNQEVVSKGAIVDNDNDIIRPWFGTEDEYENTDKNNTTLYYIFES